MQNFSTVKKTLILNESDELKNEKKENKEDNEINEKELVKDMNFFSQSSGMSNVKTDLLMQGRSKKFKIKMKGILSRLNENTPINEIFKFILQSAEDYYFCGDLKNEICRELLFDYVKDDKLYDSYILLISKELKISTFWRKQKKKLLKLVGFCLGMSGKTI